MPVALVSKARALKAVELRVGSCLRRRCLDELYLEGPVKTNYDEAATFEDFGLLRARLPQLQRVTHNVSIVKGKRKEDSPWTHDVRAATNSEKNENSQPGMGSDYLSYLEASACQFTIEHPNKEILSTQSLTVRKTSC